MSEFARRWIARFALALGALAATAPAAEQGLDEMFARVQRRAKNEFPAEKIEDAASGNAWQPETLCFKDSKTGAEIWRMTNTPNLKNYYHNDIAVTPWSADGRRMGLVSWRQSRAMRAGKEARPLWMAANTDGSRLRPTVNSEPYMHWSPLVPDTYYTFGGTRLTDVKSENNILYKVTVTDQGPATTAAPLVTYPKVADSSYGNRKFISADGRMWVAMRSVSYKDWKSKPGTPEYEIFYTPTVIFPDDKAKALLEKGYSVNRDFGDYLPEPYKKGRYHDAYLLGDGSWYFAIDKTLGYWRLKTMGSAEDGGPKLTPFDGKAFGEIVPEHTNHRKGKLNEPWGVDDAHQKAVNDKFFLGHPGFDRWGELVCYADYATMDEKGEYRMGANVYDFIAHKPLRGAASERAAWLPLSDGCTHCDWESFSDWCVTSVEKSEFSYGPSRIECFPYNETKKNFIVCYTNSMSHGTKEYYNHVRPAQSPDGTKVAWHSDFLNGAGVPDCYWAVCYSPKPPVRLAAEAAGGGVRLTWEMPSYTKRGWPKKDDPPPPAREVRRFHVWRAAAADGPWAEIGRFEPKYRVDERRACIVPEKLEFADKPGDGAWFYAITSEEWSGLESDGLSEILKVTVGGGKVAASPGGEAGKKGFWKVAPPAPTELAVKRTDSPGHYELSWKEPASDKVRYYNVYCSSFGPPPIERKNRIASLTAGTSKYLDWLADPASDKVRYAITSVDRQGNESEAATAQ